MKIIDKHILIDSKLLNQIKEIHDNRNTRSKRHKTQGDTMRMLLRIGIKQYNSESGNKQTRELERQQAREEREEKIKMQSREEKPPQKNSIMKII